MTCLNTYLKLLEEEEFLARTSGWPNNKDDYVLGDAISVTSKAIVHVAFCKPRDDKCIVKRIYIGKRSSTLNEEDIDESMLTWDHINLVTCLRSFIVKEEFWLVMKVLEGGSLYDFIKRKTEILGCRYGVFNQRTIATVLKKVLKALVFLHKYNQIHRNIKAENILLDKNGTVKITNGVIYSCLLKDKDLQKNSQPMMFEDSLYWAAPEVMKDGYSFKSDIWSFGITAIEMATGKPPYHKYHPKKVSMLTLQNPSPTLESVCDKDYRYRRYKSSMRKMISHCLRKDPAERPTAKELLRYSFFKRSRSTKFLLKTLLPMAQPLELKTQKLRIEIPQDRVIDWRYLTKYGHWMKSSSEETVMVNLKSNRKEEQTNLRLEVGAFTAQQTASSCTKEENCVKIIPQNLVPSATHEGVPIVSISSAMSEDSLNLVLSLRNQQKHCKDITLEYIQNQDQHDETSGKLLVFDHIEDTFMVAHYLQNLIHGSSLRTITFTLNEDPNFKEMPNYKDLIPFAKRHIAD